MRWQSLNESLYLLVSKNTALWELKATSWMPHQQVPQIKAKATVKEYEASLSKDYRPVAAASCVLGQKMMCQCRGPPWFSPGSQTEVWVSVSWEAFSAIAVKWNWPGKQTRSLSISRPSMSGWWVFLLFCLFACLVWNPWIPSMEHSEEKRRNEGRRGEERWGRGECVGGGDVWHADLPLRWRETCREATGQSCSTNIHRPQDQGNKDGSLSLILQQMLFLTHGHQESWFMGFLWGLFKCVSLFALKDISVALFHLQCVKHSCVKVTVDVTVTVVVHMSDDLCVKQNASLHILFQTFPTMTVTGTMSVD